MHALIHQLAAPADAAIRAPVFFLPNAAAVPVPRANEQERPETIFSDERYDFLEGRMETVIKSNSQDFAR